MKKHMAHVLILEFYEETVSDTDLYMYGLITKSVRQAREGRMCTAHFEGWERHGYSVQIYIILRFFLAR